MKPCDHCLKPSCNYCQYRMSLLVVTILQTEVYKWPQFGTNGPICCYARNVRRVQSFACNILWYIAIILNYCQALCDSRYMSAFAVHSFLAFLALEYVHVTCMSEGMKYYPYYVFVLSPGAVGHHDCRQDGEILVLHRYINLPIFRFTDF